MLLHAQVQVKLGVGVDAFLYFNLGSIMVIIMIIDFLRRGSRDREMAK